VHPKPHVCHSKTPPARSSRAAAAAAVPHTETNIAATAVVALGVAFQWSEAGSGTLAAASSIACHPHHCRPVRGCACGDWNRLRRRHPRRDSFADLQDRQNGCLQEQRRPCSKVRAAPIRRGLRGYCARLSLLRAPARPSSEALQRRAARGKVLPDGLRAGVEALARPGLRRRRAQSATREA
jgi:hypothetical protein